MFLGVSPSISSGSADGKEFNLIFDENPLAEFVELPEDATKDLWYLLMYYFVNDLINQVLKCLLWCASRGVGNGTDGSRVLIRIRRASW